MFVLTALLSFWSNESSCSLRYLRDFTLLLFEAECRPLKIQSLCVFCPPRLREKANLAVTVASEEDEIVAHASFFDHPLGGLVDQTQWEPFVQKHFGADKCTVCVPHRFLTFRQCNMLQCQYLPVR